MNKKLLDDAKEAGFKVFDNHDIYADNKDVENILAKFERARLARC